ncbi:MAG: MFS transporter [Candidatus Andeanibacterium colombiense]|uniref:MFS transporter n=1 Tax=Candidatus Andeanibacterium colombiense TaxID=3121345 RepID=A0AAJ6BNL0_9SPHN|nr:MAG: MFS transporter [Sphingomonadaceae bacterium]
MATHAAARPKSDLNYMLGLMLVLTLGNGIVGFDRQTVSFLAPFIVKDLGLNNTQIGSIAAALSLAIALSSFAGGQLADRTGRGKFVLVACTLLFSLLSGLSGFASSFMVLLLCRFALGATEGPIVPISQAMILKASSPKWRGFNMGFMQMVGAFGIAGFIGPVVATHLGESHGWRTAMFLSIIPGLIVAAMMVFLIKPDPKQRPIEAQPKGSLLADFGELLKIGNMHASLAIAGLVTAWLVLNSTFLVLFLTTEKGLAPTTAGWVIGMGGWGAFVGGILFPTISDRVGRKPVLVLGCLAAVIGPIAMLTLPADPVLLAGGVLVGWMPLGIAPLYCAAVPSESVCPGLVTTAVGLSMGFAELFGGVVVPPLAGRAADAFGLNAIFVICIGLALVAAFAALFLKETAPGKIGAA